MISFKLKKNQNCHIPLLAKDYKIKGKSNRNSLRPESCPSIIKASQIGLLFFSEKEYKFESNNYTVYKYPTRNLKNGSLGYDICTPALLGSDENEIGYFKIGNGLNIKLAGTGALILPPIDPRLKIKNIEYTIAYLPPFYAGQLVAGIKPLGNVIIPEGMPIGQLVLLNNNAFVLNEEDFDNTLFFFEDKYEILGEPIITTKDEFYF